MGIRVAVAGATGKLGSVAARLVEEHDDLELAAALDSTTPWRAMEGAQVLFDATLPAVSPRLVEAALAAGLDVVVATSGWSAERLAGLEARLPAGRRVIVVPNFSLGSVLATEFAARAALFYESVEIVETHRAGKVDSPSGTAVRTAELIAAARAGLGPTEAPHADQRARGQQVAGVPVHSLRMAGVVARQDVYFGGPGERLTITHDTADSRAYEAGILLALRSLHRLTGLTVGLASLLASSPGEAGGGRAGGAA
ncbi:MAG TPA: 4-hydroxy-tetrahydrodipicolinate reductase [Microbacteriaceae bacterium]|nr:4-hydroxy-tetrahydrodipicolinate reductase [Microbacteriaceae bacterium]